MVSWWPGTACEKSLFMLRKMFSVVAHESWKYDSKSCAIFKMSVEIKFAFIDIESVYVTFMWPLSL